MYHFMWNDQDKIKRLAIINDIENGGLRMIHLRPPFKRNK